MNVIQLQQMQKEADVMVRCWDSIENNTMPTDEDLLLFNHKGVRWLDASNKWGDIKINIVIDRKCYYPIRGIKDCLIIIL